MPVRNTNPFPSSIRQEGATLRQVRLLLRLCKLPFAFLKTTAVIPFTILVDGINGRTVLQRLEAPRTLLVLEIDGKPHTTSPSVLFRYCCQQYIACAAAGACGVVGKRSLSERLWSTRPYSRIWRKIYGKPFRRKLAS